MASTYPAPAMASEGDRVAKIAAEVERLSALVDTQAEQLETLLADAEICSLTDENTALKARVEELVAEAEDTYRDAYAEGQADAWGAQQDLWRGVIAFLGARGYVPADVYESSTAEQVMDEVREAFGDLDRKITRLEAENAALRADWSDLARVAMEARDKFRDYAEQHATKKPPAVEKAQTNLAMANRINAILAGASIGAPGILAIVTRLEAENATLKGERDSLRGALRQIANGREVKRGDHTEVEDRDDAAEIAEAALSRLTGGAA